MWFFTCAFMLLAGNQLVDGHNTFVRLSLNGEWAKPFQFIRNKTEPFEELGTPFSDFRERWWHDPTWPDTDFPNSSRCGRDNMAHAAATEVLQVKAGDKFEFVATSAPPENGGWFPPKTYWDGCPEGRGICRTDSNDAWFNRVYHDGPLIASLSQVPSGLNVREYDGSGEWVKIHTLGLAPRAGPDEPFTWLANNNSQFQGSPPRYYLSLPQQTPAGQYLLRIDSVWPGLLIKYQDLDHETIYKYAQTYAACVQIEVESKIAGSLPKGIRIPEDYTTTGIGMNMFINDSDPFAFYGDYIYPGGPLWDGENLIQDRPFPK